MNYNDLSALSNRLIKPMEPTIIEFPTMRVLSSLSKKNSQTSDPNGFLDWLKENGVPVGKPGWHEQFEYQMKGEDVILLRVDNDFIKNSEYLDLDFDRGLFVVANSYVDEVLKEQINSLISYFDDNELYEIDYAENGNLRHAVMLENLILPDNTRELISLLVPVKERHMKEGIK